MYFAAHLSLSQHSRYGDSCTFRFLHLWSLCRARCAEECQLPGWRACVAQHPPHRPLRLPPSLYYVIPLLPRMAQHNAPAVQGVRQVDTGVHAHCSSRPCMHTVLSHACLRLAQHLAPCLTSQVAAHWCYVLGVCIPQLCTRLWWCCVYNSFVCVPHCGIRLHRLYTIHSRQSVFSKIKTHFEGKFTL